jgi:tripartite-type tricarboxylate transporter receptor subunit TctC
MRCAQDAIDTRKAASLARRLEMRAPFERFGGSDMIRLATWVLLALTSALLPAHAQIPDRPVRVIVPFPPAGTSDILARLLVQAVTPDFPRGIYVENKAGAGGNIGTVEAARATADGTTIVQCTIGTCGSNPAMYANPGYDLARDFTPVILTGAVHNVMTVRKDLPAKNLAEVVALAKADPGKLSYGSAGIGASSHLTPELLRGKLGIDWTHIPYRGSGPAIIDLTGGRIDVFFDNLPSILPQIRAGNARAIVVMSEKRVSELPDVPTLAESGVPGLVIDSWFGFLAPAGTPRPVVAALNAAFGKALADPAVRAKLAEAGVIPLGGTPEQMGEYMRSEVARWGAVIRENNIKPQ